MNPFGLSNTEYAVMRLTADGFSVPAIADTLGVSTDYVRRSSSAATRKVGGLHKAHAIHILTKRGFL